MYDNTYQFSYIENELIQLQYTSSIGQSFWEEFAKLSNSNPLTAWFAFLVISSDIFYDIIFLSEIFQFQLEKK